MDLLIVSNIIVVTEFVVDVSLCPANLKTLLVVKGK